MQDSNDGASPDWQDEHLAEPDYWYDVRLVYRRRGWQPKRVEHHHFVTVQEACEFREELLANDSGVPPIDVVLLEVIDVSTAWVAPPRGRLLALLDRRTRRHRPGIRP